MNEWRAELRELLSHRSSSRPPALRRSGQEGMLYATDLPVCADEEQVRLFLGEAESARWACCRTDGWIQLTREANAPPAGLIRGEGGQEARCCLSLLQRHSDRLGPGENIIRIELIKAMEEGPAVFEKCCGRLHRDWAVRLRRGEKIPNTDPCFFISL